MAGERGTTGDCDTLALTAGERLDRLAHRADADVELRHGGARALRHGALVDHAEDAAERALTADLAAEEQVLGDVQRRRDGQILVDGLYPVAASVQRRVE